MNRRYEFSYRTKQVLTIAVYLIFFVFIIKNIITAKDNSGRLFNILILILCGVPALLYEFLRYNYDTATRKTVFDGDPMGALKQIATVEKFDILKMFKTSCVMLKTLCLIDTRNFEELKKHIKGISEKDKEDFDVSILSCYGEMIANGEMGIKGKMNDAFKRMKGYRDLKDKKGRRNKGAFFFNWNVVNGEHEFYEKDYEGAWHYLSVVSEETMNKREAMHYFIKRFLTAKQLKKTDEYNTFKERAIKAAGKNQVMIDYINEQ